MVGDGWLGQGATGQEVAGTDLALVPEAALESPAAFRRPGPGGPSPCLPSQVGSSRRAGRKARDQGRQRGRGPGRRRCPRCGPRLSSAGRSAGRGRVPPDRRVYNVASGRAVTMRHVIERLAALADWPVTIASIWHWFAQTTRPSSGATPQPSEN